MGGDGSTRWSGHARYCTVEECSQFTVDKLLPYLVNTEEITLP